MSKGRIVISGSQGLIGTELVKILESENYEVVRLVRRPAKTEFEVSWDPSAGKLDFSVLEGCKAVINLAGESVAQIPWTKARKKRIYDSRINSTSLLVAGINTVSEPPELLISGSASGYYGNRPRVLLNEAEPPASDHFLAELASAWESEAVKAEQSCRVIRVRTGLVLAPKGGALTPFLPLIKLGLGVHLGAGKQIWPWISLTDQSRAIAFLVNSELEGAVNLTAGAKNSSDQVLDSVAAAMQKKIRIRIPRLLTRVGGAAVTELLFDDQWLSSEKLKASGFEFSHPTLDQATKALFSR